MSESSDRADRSSPGEPGVPPYRRGLYPGMYRDRLWTIRQFSGFGTSEDTNRRFRYLLANGQTGLSVAFDLPTLMGYDSDHPMAAGEVGRCGVAMDSLADMETLFEGIPLDSVSTSMTTNAPAAIIWAMYLVAARKRGFAWTGLSGTIQNDILKEYIAQKTYIFPPKPSMRLVVDTLEFASKHVPKWNPISISGYHIREAGSTALQELAFTLYDGIEYVEAALARGLDVDDFAPRLSFFFNSHNDLFEEIAKFRAARAIWHRVMTGRFGARNPRSAMLRFHAQTAGCSLTAEQPYNNVVRTSLQALAAVLGGAQSIHTNSLDETLALPTEHSARIALRTQQILAWETGVTRTVDPFGGSWRLETLTRDLEEGSEDYFRRLDAMGGMVSAIERGFPQREIQEASWAFQRAVDSGEVKLVGVNDFVSPGAEPLETLRIDPAVGASQTERLDDVRRSRNDSDVARALDALEQAARTETNVMEPILEAVACYATLGEMCDVLRRVFGIHEEAAVV